VNLRRLSTGRIAALSIAAFGLVLTTLLAGGALGSTWPRFASAKDDHPATDRIAPIDYDAYSLAGRRVRDRVE
jgi:hypothetical protein